MICFNGCYTRDGKAEGILMRQFHKRILHRMNEIYLEYEAIEKSDLLSKNKAFEDCLMKFFPKKMNKTVAKRLFDKLYGYMKDNERHFLYGEAAAEYEYLYLEYALAKLIVLEQEMTYKNGIDECFRLTTEEAEYCKEAFKEDIEIIYNECDIEIPEEEKMTPEHMLTMCENLENFFANYYDDQDYLLLDDSRMVGHYKV